MGNAVPSSNDRVAKVIDRLPHLGEKKQITKLHRSFLRASRRSGYVSREGFFQFVGERRTVFGDSIFELVDVAGNSMDWGEYFEVVTTFCMFGTEEMLKFCFFVFDKDKNGTIEADELTSLVDMLHDAGQRFRNVDTALRKFDLNGDGRVDFGEFQALHRSFPQLLFPAFRLQQKLMQRTLGIKYWETLKQGLAAGRFRARRASERELRRLAKIEARAKRREERRKAGGTVSWLLKRVERTVRAQFSSGIAGDLQARSEREALGGFKDGMLDEPVAASTPAPTRGGAGGEQYAVTGDVAVLQQQQAHVERERAARAKQREERALRRKERRVAEASTKAAPATPSRPRQGRKVGKRADLSVETKLSPGQKMDRVRVAVRSPQRRSMVHTPPGLIRSPARFRE